MNNVNYVISLPTAVSRRQHIQNVFQKQNVSFEFFDAISPDAGLDAAMRRFVPNLQQAEHLTAGEKSCFMSHVSLWQKCLDENLPYIAIFEDDILLGENASDFLSDYQWFEARFDLSRPTILKLETALGKTNFKPLPQIEAYQSRQFMRLTVGRAHIGMAGYIISHATAKALLRYVKARPAHTLKAIDLILFDDLLKNPDFRLVQLYPAVCVQDSFYNKNNVTLLSSLEMERAHLKKVRPYIEPKSLFDVVRKIVTTPYRKYLKLQRRIVPFK